MGGYELVSSQNVPSTSDALLEIAHHAPTAAVGVLTKMAAQMKSASTWNSLVGRSLVHGNLHIQAYAAEVMASDGVSIEESERLIALRAGRSAVLLANKVRQKYVLTHGSLSPPLDVWGKPIVSHDTLYHQLDHILDITSEGSPVKVLLTNDSDLGALQRSVVDYLFLTDEHDPVVNIESDAPGVIVDKISVPGLVENFQSVDTLAPDLSRQIIEQHWKALRYFGVDLSRQAL